ncbi:MAG TPA: helix-turn-helix domain-containing protein [Acidimicrobiia bacterium]|nr:helix-turn-helix domain-containing protein [Acidimicrobiia bacterium]
MASYDTPQYLTSGESARLLNVSPKTVNRWAAQGLLPCIVTMGGHRRFRREDIEKALESMSRPT